MLVFFLQSCIKKECQIAGVTYEFEIPATFSPARDTFYVGDTITVASVFSNEVYERETDKWYRLKNFKFYPDMWVREISDTIVNNAALNDFEVIVDSIFNFGKAIFNDGSVSYYGNYNYEIDTEKYSLVYKLVPLKTGFYYFSHALLIGQFGEHQNFEGKCKNLEVDAAVNLNEGADNNIDMLRDSPDSYFNNWILIKPEDRFYKFGGYCFYVKE